MSAWRVEAADRLPELWKDESARDTLYLFLFDVLPFVRDAHRAGDRSALERGYGFARWCFRRDVSTNAVCVAFYEHLFDVWDIHADVLRWIGRDVLQVCWELFEARLDAEKLGVLRQHLAA